MPAHISELIFQKVATEIEPILRLSRLKEYARPEQYYTIESLSLKLDMTLTFD